MALLPSKHGGAQQAVVWLAAVAFLSAPGRRAAADVVEQGVRDSRPSGLLAGVSKLNIDPTIGIPHMNWGSATHLVTRGNDPVGLYLRVLVLSDGKMKFVLVDTDTPVANSEKALQRASELTGIPVDHMRIGSCHTHAGPSLNRSKGPAGVDMTPYQQMMEAHQAVVADKLVGAIVEANSRLRPAHANGMTGTGSININRRFRGSGTDESPPAVGLNPKEFVDRELPVIRIDDAEGNPFVVLVNFQAHGTVLGFENQIASADWPGEMRKTVEESLPGATCLFFQGAAGNQGPIEGFSGDLSVAHRLGKILGHEAAALALRIWTVRRKTRFEGYVESTALQARQPYRVLGPYESTMRYASKILELPRRAYTKEDIARMERLTASAAKALEEVQNKAGATPWEVTQAGARHRRWADLLARYQKSVDRAPVRLEVAVLADGAGRKA
ncbi:MAG: hypothetical protein ACUVXB_06580 [Bryobacteraceae bacterium]